MNSLRAVIPTTGTSVSASVLPTCKIFIPLLLTNSTHILSTPLTTHTYGPHPRQTLDLYRSSTSTPSTSPLLIYLYGGGLIHGDKIIPTIPQGLVYHNLGTFFSSRGVNVIVADYRRVNSEFGGEDAVFPSGGEDLSCVLKWVVSAAGKEVLGSENAGKEREVFLMGNSAGGLHISTFLLEPRFLEQRRSLCAGNEGVRLSGVVGIGIPLHFKSAAKERYEELGKYYGDMEEVGKKCPYGLLEAAGKTGKSKEETGIPRLVLFVSEWDPEDEVLEGNRDFVALLERVWGEKVDFRTMEGHNHISPPMALGSGEGEEWAEEVVKWIKG